MLDKVTRMAWLFDFYGALLTEKQRNLVELYYHQDYSLAEIAEFHHVSRQAVHDLIKRAENALGEYEQSLGFLARHQQQLATITKIDSLLSTANLKEPLATLVGQLMQDLQRIN